jgi:hypothetical protein
MFTEIPPGGERECPLCIEDSSILTVNKAPTGAKLQRHIDSSVDTGGNDGEGISTWRRTYLSYVHTDVKEHLHSILRSRLNVNIHIVVVRSPYPPG